ncbi:Ribosomal RNA small subunit methyltransferase I [compost metagenome]
MYESPHRLTRTLESLLDAWGNRQIVLARELTKRYEEMARGTVQACLEWLEAHPPVGEYCIVVEGADPQQLQEKRNAWWKPLSILEHVAHYEQEGLPRKEAMKRAANDRGVSKRDIYQALI